MDYPWYDLLMRFNEKHPPQPWLNNPQNKKAAVLVEGRALWYLPIVIELFRHFLGDGWNFYLFHSRFNDSYMQRIHPDARRYIVDVPHINPQSFSDLLLNSDFWNSFTEDHLLFFQPDSIACKPFDDAWLAYDFIGAPCGENAEIFNGGLSLRHRETMLKALDKFSWVPIKTEDIFFSRALRAMNAKLPNGYRAGCFSVENFYYEHPFGFHGTDKGYLSLTLQEKIASEIEI